MKLALLGNPNCGKTTLYNALTGSSQYVGNWPGVTVEKKEGKLRGNRSVTVTDLPGVYSLSPYTLEEVITRNYLLHDRPDVVVNLVDASNIERNLYLTTQLLECGIPVVIALNMIDVAEKNGDMIDDRLLSKRLGCPVVRTAAVTGLGLQELTKAALAQAGASAPAPIAMESGIEGALGEIAALIAASVEPSRLRWFAVKVFERDEQALEGSGISADVLAACDAITKRVESDCGDDAESIITGERYAAVAELVGEAVRKKARPLTTSDKIDRVVTNRLLALPIFGAVMFFIYYISVTTIGDIVTVWTNDTLFGETIMPAVGGWLASIGASAWLQGLVVDGIIGGVGAVLGFVPQMLILFLLLSILEDCGYMARVAFIMDRVFRRFGLSGKSFIPILIGSGCGVPGVMAARTIENEMDRKMTIIVTTFIPCGAKLPVIALIAGALFPDNAWIGPGAYFLGIAVIVLSGIILKKTRAFQGDPAPFVMELPQYHMPRVKGVLIHMWERGKAFIMKAGTVIFAACGLIWFLGNFGFEGGAFGMVEQNASLLASLGSLIAPVFAPLGFGSWQAAVATVSGLVAKENVVGTFGVLFGLAEATEDDPALLAQLGMLFTAVSGMAFLVFNLLCAPCFAAIGAIKREMGSWRWTLYAVGYQTGFAYVVALMVNQFGAVLVLGAPFTLGTAAASIAAAGLLYLVLRRPSKRRDNAAQKRSVAAAR